MDGKQRRTLRKFCPSCIIRSTRREYAASRVTAHYGRSFFIVAALYFVRVKVWVTVTNTMDHADITVRINYYLPRFLTDWKTNGKHRLFTAQQADYQMSINELHECVID